MEIRSWMIIKGDKDTYYINGFIYGDNRGKFEDGDHINTSRLESVDFVNKIAKTKNSTYKLGAN